MADVSYTQPAINVQPIGTNVKPVPGMTLGEMVNVARGSQLYKTEKIALTLEQQREAERAKLQEYLARPENFQSNGRIDLDKLNAEIPKIAPLTGGDVIQKFTTLAGAQTQAIDAKQRLTQEQRNMVGQRFAILGRLGVQDKAAYLAEMDLLKKENPDNPDLAKLIDAYKTTWQDIPSGPQLPSMAIAGANTLLNVQAQQQLFAPQAGTISTGAATFPTTTRPSVAGEAPTIDVGTKPLAIAQLPPGSRVVGTGRIGPDNRELMNVFGPNGDPLGTFSMGDLEASAAGRLPTGPLTPTGNVQTSPVAAPSNQLPSVYQAPVRIPPFETQESGNTYRTQAMAAREQVQPARNAVDNIRTIRQYLPLAQTGRYSEAIAGLQSVLGNVAGSKPEELAAAARDIIEKNIADLALQKNSALGGKFAADLAAVQNSLATAGKNPTAIAKVMDQLEPLMQHVANYSTGLERAIAKSPNSYYAKPEFDRAMNEAYDPLALRMKNAFDSGGREGLNKWLKDNKVNLTEQQMLLQKLQAYGRLVRGD